MPAKQAVAEWSDLVIRVVLRLACCLASRCLRQPFDKAQGKAQAATTSSSASSSAATMPLPEPVEGNGVSPRYSLFPDDRKMVDPYRCERTKAISPFANQEGRHCFAGLEMTATAFCDSLKAGKSHLQIPTTPQSKRATSNHGSSYSY